jgi:hypothetical protein
VCACSDAKREAVIRTDDDSADRTLRTNLQEAIFWIDLAAKLVDFRSPERCHSAGAFPFGHVELADFYQMKLL